MPEIVIAIAVAILGSSGMWAFFTHVLDGRAKGKEDKLAEISEKLDGIVDTLEHTKQVSLSTTRDRLNYQCNKFLSQGYVPVEDYDAFIDMGDAYVQAGGNSVVKGKFEKCKDLEVK